MTQAPRPASTNPPRRPGLKQRLAVWMRWLHIYSSLFGLVAILFFSVTGLTLNHPDWLFGSIRREQHFSGKVNPEWAKSESGEVAKLEIVEHLRKEHKVRGFLSDFTIDDVECMVTFKGPGYSADTFLQRKDGSYELSIITDGWVAVLNDLHKGRNTGPAWSLLIDISAVLLIIISLTGLVLLLYIKRRRFSGLMIGAAGAAIVFLIAWWVS